MPTSEPPRKIPSPLVVAAVLLLSLLGLLLHVVTMLESAQLAQTWFSVPAWETALNALGGELLLQEGEFRGLVPMESVGGLLTLLLGCLVALGTWRSRWGGMSRQDRVLSMGNWIGCWGLIAFGWSAGWLVASIQGWSGLLSLLMITAPLVLPVVLAGMGHAVWMAGRVSDDSASSKSWNSNVVLAAMILGYLLVFVSMNWGLWFNLQIPHGDSAMYEEHLWNFEHGKGFRSYLDQGLFLGEHIQFVHLFLVPLHALWPSHLLLELCESLALASAILPIYRLTLRHSGSRLAGYLLSAAYLCWFGVHYLDIAIDLKTFRPIAFGVPLMLWWLDALETGRWKTSLVLLFFLLSCKEDFAIVTAPVGLWLAVDAWRRTDLGRREKRFRMFWGLAHAALLTAYLLLVVKVLIPWFRNWENVHYAAYFQALGATPTEIVQTMLFHPLRTFSLFVTLGSTLYALYLLVPLMGLPLRSPGRLLTALPLFLTLCLNELVKTTPGPFHHFHAPLIPILFWAAAAGSGRRWQDLCPSWFTKQELSSVPDRPALAVQQTGLAFACCVTTAVVFSMAPCSLQFWDAERPFYWRTLYVPGERARMFAPVADAIPHSARVASTDFVHPRFTHCERSYDYSKYPRKVANYEDRVPTDTDYIVIDTGHRYSELRREEILRDPGLLQSIRELRESPDEWELLPLETGQYFIVLKRIRQESPVTPGTANSPAS
ncbi:MAG: DUF2079 domain-containing protein [Planctomycetaceae bacterium]|nr:DUF2079 domain-containing protein [Planctomycetaceae bacterium]